MFAYIVRKTIFSIVVLFFSSIVIFGLVALGPNPLTELKLNPRVTQADIERITAEYGLDQPLPVQYGIWMRDIVLHGERVVQLDHRAQDMADRPVDGNFAYRNGSDRHPFRHLLGDKEVQRLGQRRHVSLVRGLQHADLLVGAYSPARLGRLPHELGRVSCLFHLGDDQRGGRRYRGPSKTS